jgi:hypothetical protein
MKDRIPQRIADGIANFRLKRAAKMNALYPAMVWAIAELDVRHGMQSRHQTTAMLVPQLDDLFTQAAKTGSIGKIRKAA